MDGHLDILCDLPCSDGFRYQCLWGTRLLDKALFPGVETRLGNYLNAP